MSRDVIDIAIESLSWESDFFSLPTAKLNFESVVKPSDAKLINADQLSDAIALLDMTGYKLVQAKVPMYQTDWVDALMKNHFTLVEGEVDLAYELAPLAESENSDISEMLTHFNRSNSCSVNDWYVTVANAVDIEYLQHTASELFKNSRFRAPWYKTSDSGKFYAKWIEKAVLGTFDNICLVIKSRASEDEHSIVGFVSLRDLGNQQARIGLLGAIRKSSQQEKKPIGMTLVAIAKLYCQMQQFNKLYVATQSSNIGALRLYIKSGANVISSAYWFYKQVQK